MAKPLLTFEEVVAMLGAVEAPAKLIARFQTQAEALLAQRNQRETESETHETEVVDTIIVASTFGQRTKRGYVELTFNNQRTQMEPKKAREVGLMLLEAAEAATSDEVFVGLLVQLGVTAPEAVAKILLDLRQIRQGTRGTAWPQ
jgi:hypothetical protein